ncbi:MAG TPA: hypothetical protein VN043_07590, partial [Rhodanobacter sp.]|nr:hypothetical protein [Rhodanobacter sp.]
IFDSDETREILYFFFPDISLTYLSENTQITDDLKKFALGILIECYSSHDTLWAIQTLFDSSTKPNASMTGILKAFAKFAVKNYAHKWIKRSEADKLLGTKEYNVAVGVIRSNFAFAYRSLFVDGITYDTLTW